MSILALGKQQKKREKNSQSKSWTLDGLSVTDLVLCLPLALDLVAYWSAMGRKQRSNLFVDELR